MHNIGVLKSEYCLLAGSAEGAQEKVGADWLVRVSRGTAWLGSCETIVGLFLEVMLGFLKIIIIIFQDTVTKFSLSTSMTDFLKYFCHSTRWTLIGRILTNKILHQI